jgi:hypothetical protein
MEFNYSTNKIIFNRELSNLDILVLRFVKTLHKLNIRYVIISGYIAILFGRARNTIDVDLFIEKIDRKKMEEWWDELEKEGFDCINAFSSGDASSSLNENVAIRFCAKGKPEPNFEIKFPTKSKYNEYSLEKRVIVLLNGETLYTSEIELQIAYKVFLGSEKDYEDARHLFALFKNKVDMNLLWYHIRELDVEKQAKRILRI